MMHSAAIEVFEATYNGKASLQVGGRRRVNGGPAYGAWQNGHPKAVLNWLTRIRAAKLA